jgi:hypothetical protein
MTGDIVVRLHKGSATVIKRRSPHSLYSESFATFGADEVYDQSHAGGFIRLHSLPARIRALKAKHAIDGAKGDGAKGDGGGRANGSRELKPTSSKGKAGQPMTKSHSATKSKSTSKSKSAAGSRASSSMPSAPWARSCTPAARATIRSPPT